MAFTDIDNPELYFQTKLYTGNNSDGNAITLDGDENMQPDLVWSATRNNSMSKRVYDSVRGVNAALLSDTSAAEDQYAAYGQFESFNSDGFTVGVGTNSDGTQGYATNTTGHTYVAWCWKAGTSFSNDASATSIGSIDSSGSASDSSGFSICSYTGTGSAGTIKHGLSSAPKMIIIKRRSNAENWAVYHNSIANTKTLYLDLTLAEDTASNWNNTSSTSSVFSVGTPNMINGSSDTYIAYCFADVQGAVKCGSYIGNGASNTDGAFIYLGFRPAMVLVKRTNGAKDWKIFDNKRNGYNGSNEVLEPNDSGAEDTTEFLDFLSNGFKWRIPSSDAKYADVNGEDDTFIYLAFAEAPFVNSKGVPCNAR
jgi:hypothetical protein